MSINSANKPKKGRPPVDTEAVNVRVLRTTIDDIDEFRRDEEDLPTRPEAIRRLVDIALGALKKEEPPEKIVHRFVTRMTRANNPSPADLAAEILADHPHVAKYEITGNDVEYTLKDGQTFFVTNDSDFFTVTYEDGERRLERIFL